MDFDQSLRLSDDCKTLAVSVPDGAALSAEQVEACIRALMLRRFLMEPTAPGAAPTPPKGPECMLTGLSVLPSNQGDRIALHLGTRNFGWLLVSIPLALVPSFVKDVVTASIAAGALAQPPQGKPPGATAQ